MKKLLLLFAFTLIVAMSFAQPGTVKNAVSAFSLTTDTVTNTETLYMTLTVPDRDAYLVVQPDIDNLTGTTAGTARLEARIAGNWVPLNSENSDIEAGQDTLTLVDNASTIWKTKIMVPYYRVAFISTGTHTSTIKAPYWYLEIKE